MKTGRWLIGMILGLAALQSGNALAGDEQPVTKATNKDDFTAMSAAIRQQIGPGGRWQSTSKLEKEDINRRLDDMQSLFNKFGTVDQMDASAKMQLFNDQEAVNETLTKRDDNRLVCTYETPTGTHIQKRVCRTYGQIREDRENSQKYLYDRLATPQLKHGG